MPSTPVNISIIYMYKEFNYGTIQIVWKYFKLCILDNFKAEVLRNIQREKLELKKSLLGIERKKLDVLTEICVELKRKKTCCCSYSFQTIEPLVEFEPASCSVSPAIKGIVKEI